MQIKVSYDEFHNIVVHTWKQNIDIIMLDKKKQNQLYTRNHSPVEAVTVAGALLLRPRSATRVTV